MEEGFESTTMSSTSTSSNEQEEKNTDANASSPTAVLHLKTKQTTNTNTATAAGAISTSSSSSSPKKSGGRRSVQKRVVSVPIVDVDVSRPKGSGEGAPPSDSWAWRKYGQKPIKGSPYPRGYYRCSSSKGCPARKQVERSRVDPTMLVITYASEHDHPWPLPRNHNHHHQSNSHHPTPQPPSLEMEEEPSSPTPVTTTTTTITSSPEEPTTTTFSTDLGEDDSPLMPMSDDFCWPHLYMTETSLFSDVAMMLPVSFDDVGKDLATASCGAKGEEDDSLFAGLGELPECSVVFRRWCSLTATS